ncbi:PAS domain-containing protein [Flavobacterium agrisoli]|uniref:histidine kinase n=1 Tax=Flavobacterium agrisoli TaxID=2793066 RepID=A0A934UJT1_9FLAO|nr:PAS domain-containing protein [Flavobacterium agrisoli]MBK0370217.1 PAS domain-containing protein [Flavobacterium agrisoli]
MIVSHPHLDLLQYLPNMVFIALPDGKVLFYNKKWNQYTGAKLVEGKEWPPKEITHPTDLRNSNTQFLKQIHKGKIFEIENRYLQLDGTYRWFSNYFEPVKDAAGTISFWVGTAMDIEDSKHLATEIANRNQQLEEIEIKFTKLILNSSFPIAVFRGENLIAEIANEAYFPIVGKSKNEFLGKPLFDSLPEIKETVAPIIEEVIRSGNTFTSDEFGVNLNPTGTANFRYFNFIYEAVRDSNGNINGVMTTAMDVTEQVLARKALEESEAHLELLRDTVPAMIFYLDNQQRYQSYNSTFMEWYKVDSETAIGKTVLEFIGPDAYKKVMPQLRKAYAGQNVQYEMTAPSRIGPQRWLSIVYTPHFNTKGEILGIIVHATDITKSKQIEISLRESEHRFRSLIEEAPVATCLFMGPEMKVVIANDMMLKEWGKDASVIGKPFKDAVPELIGQPFLGLLDQVFATGEAYSESAAPATLEIDGELQVSYYNYTYKPLFDENGAVYGIMDMAYNVTENVLANQKLEASEKELRDLINASPIGICVVTGSPIKVVEVNERFLHISGKTRAQYDEMPYWETLEEVAHLFESEMNRVFETGNRYTTEEHKMMLIRDGIEETIFLTFEYIPILNASQMVSKVIVMAFEVTHQVEIRKKIEAAVTQRTKELAEANNNLQRSNSALEQFAHIASHDLQEPVRKISTYANMLEIKIGETIDGKAKMYLDKISISAERMSALIRDVLAFSEVSHHLDSMEMVDLQQLLQEIEIDFELQIEKKGAIITYKGLPTLPAIPTQMLQLFSNLLSNSLKYTQTNTHPRIDISSRILSKNEIKEKGLLENQHYHCITFADNGIGFDEHQAERIFKIFQRLHGKTEYEGTGIGLALCRKIVYNHQGDISAKPGQNGGAVFTIILPI